MTTSAPALWHGVIEESRIKFDESNLDFNEEQIFATQMLMNNDYLLQTATKNKTSLKLAMYNVAAVGLTLNPNLGLAYLVPRKSRSNEPAKVNLDISYRGLISIAVDAGAITCASAELVCSKDTFEYRGAFERPIHHFDPFLSLQERGEIRGGYVTARMASGDVMVTAMSRADMDKIKNKSEAFKAGFGPWIDWEDQMMLKSIVKRAFKWWPKPSQKMGQVIKILNEDNGEGITFDTSSNNNQETLPPPPPKHEVRDDVVNFIERLVGRAEAQSLFEQSRELVSERFSDPLELSYAYDQLSKAEKKSRRLN